MAKPFVCSIDVQYLPSWGEAEGIRELLQNGRDAEIQYNAKLTVKWRRDTQTLVIRNDGCRLPLKSLLIGFSTKRDDRRLAGQYGEGLVFGILALLRDGHSVTIKTGGEVWLPRIEEHEQVKQDVLVFGIREGNKDENRVSVEVSGVSDAVWKSLPKKFLFLAAPDNDETKRVKTEYGTLLLGKETRGDLYVKGIWVCHDPEMAYAYDFSDCDTDRDRKMIDTYDLRNAVRKVWMAALRTRPDLIWDFLKLVSDQCRDVLGIDNWSADSFDQDTRQKFVDHFKKTFGEDAVPVSTFAESMELEHFGRKGIVVSNAMRALLETVMGKLADIKTKLAKENRTKYSWGDLTNEEKTNLDFAFVKFASARLDPPITMSVLDIVDFRDEKIEGLYQDGRVLIARKMLGDKRNTLLVLVHEVAHLVSEAGDGEKHHVATIEDIWSRIVMANETSEPDEDVIRHEAFRRATLDTPTASLSSRRSLDETS